NGDGAIRSGDVEAIRARAGGRIVRNRPANETQLLCIALDAFRRSAAGQGGPTLDNIHALIGTTRDKLRARDTDSDGVITDTERRRSMSAPEHALLGFAEACRGLSVAD